MQVAVSGLLSLALLWTASSIARGKGLILFALGALAIAWSLRLLAQGERRPFFRVFFVLLLAAIAVLTLEGMLAVSPRLVRGRVANYTFGGYHAERGGIYAPHPSLGLALKPGFRRRLFWNGHSWSHETNEDGYRGPRLARAEAVFLGDSMVYGHGVEQDETVPAQFGHQGDRAAANLGQPGIGVVQALILFVEKGARLQPRQVFVCLHPNDAEDSSAVYSEDELRRFVQEPRRLPLARLELRTPRASNIFELWERNVALPLRGARLISGLRGKPDWTLLAPAPSGDAADSRSFVPSHQTLVATYAPLASDSSAGLRLGWQANRAALAELKHLATQGNAELVVFDLGYPREFTDAVESMAKELGATYNPAGRVVLSRAIAGEPMYLGADGHWTPRACDVIAWELLHPR